MLKVIQGFYAPKTIITTTSISIGYLLLSDLLIGFKPEQLVLALLFNLLYYASNGSRKMITGFSIFLVYWILFDYMKAFPNYLFNDVSIQGLYQLERKLFGITVAGNIVTPNEFFNIHQSTIADVLAGIFYLCWVPVPLLFAGYLFVKNRKLFLEFALCFLLVNLIGFVIYYIVPAAPPWYVQLHGFEFIADTPGNTAGLHRFDEFFNISLFSGMYEKGSNVFAAMPSLHSAYPIIVLYYSIKNRTGAMNAIFMIIMLGIWMAAVYTSHHYVLDVIAGICCALVGFALMEQLKKTKPFQRFLQRYLQLIS